MWGARAELATCVPTTCSLKYLKLLPGQFFDPGIFMESMLIDIYVANFVSQAASYDVKREIFSLFFQGSKNPHLGPEPSQHPLLIPFLIFCAFVVFRRLPHLSPSLDSSLSPENPKHRMLQILGQPRYF